MTVRELIAELEKYPPDEKVYRDGGEYKDDYTPVHKVKPFKFWGQEGILVN